MPTPPPCHQTGVLMNAQQLADLTAFLVNCKDKAKNSNAQPETGVQFEQSEGQVAILINGQNVGT